MTNWRIRFAAVAIVAAAVGACQVAPDPNAPRKLTDDVSVSGQITAANLKALKAQGFRTVVDMVHDDDSPDQAKYKQMQSAANESALGYGYVPLKKGTAIPSTTAEALGSTMRMMPKPILIYADTRARAARTWAFAEASRQGGLDAAHILAAVKSAGESADDLASQIDARVAARPKH